MNWKYNSDQKMKIIVHLKIREKVQLGNGNKSSFINWKCNYNQKMEIILNKIKKGITVQLQMEMKIQLENANENSI